MREPPKNKRKCVGRAGLPKAMVFEIRARREAGETYRDIASAMGISVKTAHRYGQSVGLNVRGLEDMKNMEKEIMDTGCLIEPDVECHFIKKIPDRYRSVITLDAVSKFCQACVLRRNAKDDAKNFKQQFTELSDNLAAITGVKTVRPPNEPPKKDDEEPKEDGSRDDDRSG